MSEIPSGDIFCAVHDKTTACPGSTNTPAISMRRKHFVKKNVFYRLRGQSFGLQGDILRSI